MVIYISSRKYQPMISKILKETDQVCAESDVGDGIFLKKYIKENLATFESIDLFIIDFSALADTDEEIIQGIESLRIMDYKTRCIIIAPYRKAGEKIFKDFFYAGIYDLIVNDEYLAMSEQLTYCITSGMKYKDAIRFRDAITQEETAKTVAIQKVLIGIAGAGDRSGCTHTAIVTANFLRKKNQMVAIMEMNQKGAFQTILDNHKAKLFEDGYFTLSGIDYYPDSSTEQVTAVSGRLYNFIILDFGNYEMADKIMFNRCDVRIVCSGVKPWEVDSLQNIFEEQEEDVLKKYHFCFLCTTSGKLQREICEHMEPLKNIWFPEYSEDPFLCSTFPEGQNIFAEYIKIMGHEETRERRGLPWKKKR